MTVKEINDIECPACNGYRYELLGCCSGAECGCHGKPVDSRPCQECNSDGQVEPSAEAKTDWPWFFNDSPLHTESK